jgi:hypothetical protein
MLLFVDMLVSPLIPLHSVCRIRQDFQHISFTVPDKHDHNASECPCTERAIQYKNADRLLAGSLGKLPVFYRFLGFLLIPLITQNLAIITHFTTILSQSYHGVTPLLKLSQNGHEPNIQTLYIHCTYDNASTFLLHAYRHKGQFC